MSGLRCASAFAERLLLMSALPHKFYELMDEGLQIFVRATPAAAKNEMSGIWNGANGEQRLAVKVTAAPDKGKANDAIVKLLAKCFGLPKSSLSIMSGEASRLKTIAIAGNRDELAARVKRVTGELK